MKRSIRNHLLLPAAAVVMAFGLTGCNNQGNSPRDGQSEQYAPNGNGASPGAGVGTGRGQAGSENGQPAGNSGTGGSTASTGNGGANAGGSGGEASTPTSRP